MTANPTIPTQTGWAAVREMLVQFVRASEVALFRSRMAPVRHVLVIGSCLGMPLLETWHRTAGETRLALVASDQAETCGSVPTSGADLIAAGSLAHIQLPKGWAEGILGHCVLDELV
jgi:hypothetical protein